MALGAGLVDSGGWNPLRDERRYRSIGNSSSLGLGRRHLIYRPVL
jgi:hypothetical protein